MTLGGATRSMILLGAGCLFAGGAVSAQERNLKVALDGPSVYKEYCSACHGADGKGHGPSAQSLKVKPANLTVLAKNNKGMFPRQTLQDLITDGGRWKAHGSKEMPTWGPIFVAVDADDRIAYAHVYNLVTYLESIQVK